MLRVGIVGHCSFMDRQGEAFASNQCGVLLGSAHACASVVAISALAQGADTFFAQHAVDMGLPMHSVRPFAYYSDDFATVSARSHYRSLLAYAEHGVSMPYQRRSGWAYRAAMRWVADHSDILVAVWDGRRSRRAGSTGETVAYARRLGGSVVHVDPVAQRVLRHDSC